jgi:glycosyltransferase involved in cell wall biosynthesis
MMRLRNVKIALVHDWLTGMRGGERCLEAFLKLYPEADIFTLLHVPGTTSSLIDNRVVQTSVLQKLPWSRRFYRHYLPLYPLAAQSLRLDGYDMVISLSHAAAKNVSVPLGVPHLCYCFTPMRYVWDQAHVYFGSGTRFLWPLLSRLRRWDQRGAEGVSRFIAISRFVAARIRLFYGRQSDIIYPPVDTSWISPIREPQRGKAFLYAGALVPYKRVELVVEVFNRLREPLHIVGDGPLLKSLKKQAGDTITFYGRVSDAELAEHYRQCRALVFPAREDFGMIPVECMAAGRPIIGFAEGGLRETVDGLDGLDTAAGALRDGITGVFAPPSADLVLSLQSAVRSFLAIEEEIAPQACIERAQLFSPEKFAVSWSTVAEKFAKTPDLIDVQTEHCRAAGE